MPGPWTITNRSGIAGAVASASEPAPASGLAQNQQVRLIELSATLAGTAAGTSQLVVRDGPSGTGAIIWQWDLSIVAGAADRVFFDNLDLRASPGNALTVEFVAGVASDFESVNAVGDIVPVGYPLGYRG